MKVVVKAEKMVSNMVATKVYKKVGQMVLVLVGQLVYLSASTKGDVKVVMLVDLMGILLVVKTVVGKVAEMAE